MVLFKFSVIFIFAAAAVTVAPVVALPVPATPSGSLRSIKSFRDFKNVLSSSLGRKGGANVANDHNAAAAPGPSHDANIHPSQQDSLGIGHSATGSAAQTSTGRKVRFADVLPSPGQKGGAKAAASGHNPPAAKIFPPASGRITKLEPKPSHDSDTHTVTPEDQKKVEESRRRARELMDDHPGPGHTASHSATGSAASLPGSSKSSAKTHITSNGEKPDHPGPSHMYSASQSATGSAGSVLGPIHSDSHHTVTSHKESSPPNRSKITKDYLENKDLPPLPPPEPESPPHQPPPQAPGPSKFQATMGRLKNKLSFSKNARG